MNRVWMITGAGRGLGHAFAEEAVKNGEKVIATVRKINDTDPLMKNENVLPVIMDVTKKRKSPLRSMQESGNSAGSTC